MTASVADRSTGARGPYAPTPDTAEHKTAPPTPARLKSVAARLRLSITILVTLAVVVGEFALLHAIYRYNTPVERAQVVVGRLDGELTVADSSSVRHVERHARLAAGQLARLGVSQTALAPLTERSRGATQPTAQQRLTELRLATGRLGTSLARRDSQIKRDVDLIYIAVLIVVSLGWMVWFRRLVARHRRLQETVTEHQLLSRGEQRLAALVRNAADLVILCDPGGIISYVTPSSSSVLGRSARDLNGSMCLDLVAGADRERFATALATLREDEDRDLRVRMNHVDGRPLDVEGTISNLMTDPAVGGVVITVRDVTDRVQLEAQLRHQAFHDSLTHLANRQLFSDRLAHAIERRQTTGDTLAVLFCDLDEFKNINDSLGHRVGDLVLCEVGRRALQVTRSVDTVARLGGDEFAILLEGVDVDAAMTVAAKLLDAMQVPIVVDGQTLLIRASVGVAFSGDEDLSGDDLLRNADVAMYLAKERGKGTIAVYDSELHLDQLDRLTLRSELQQALQGDELQVYYQPTIDLLHGGIAGFEALVRWQHPTRGLLGPVEFVPIAERTGLIHDLGRIVLRSACSAAVDFSRQAGRPVSVAVNVAAQQLGRADFTQEVIRALEDSRLPGRQLTLEITETVLLQDISDVIERLSELRRCGVRIAIDDFGTGYSSLAYLRELPLDVLKVDKAFVDRVATDGNDASLTQAIIEMSRSMQLTTVAEGVEHPAQAAWLVDVNCRYGQGYLWSRAVPHTEAVALLLVGELSQAPGATAPEHADRLNVASIVDSARTVRRDALVGTVASGRDRT